MDIEVKSSSAKELRFVLKGERYTFSNILREALLQDSSVTFAAYTLPHPLGNESEFIVKAKGKRPKAALAEAAKKVEKQLAEFEKAFKAAK